MNWTCCLVLPAAFLLSSCLATDAAGSVARGTGKVAVGAVKLTGQAAWAGAKGAASGVQYVAGRRVVKLERQGNSYYIGAVLNGRTKVRLLLDTGASSVQIPASVAKQMGIDLRHARRTTCILASGAAVSGWAVTLREVNAGGAKARNIDAVVIEGAETGLLGMSFLNHFNWKFETADGELILRPL